MTKLTPEYLIKISEGWDSGEDKVDSSVAAFLHYHDNVIPYLDTPKAQEYWDKITQSGKYTTGREAHQLLRMLLDDRNNAFMQDPEKMAQLMKLKELAENRYGPTGIANPADYMNNSDDVNWDDVEYNDDDIVKDVPIKKDLDHMHYDHRFKTYV